MHCAPNTCTPALHFTVHVLLLVWAQVLIVKRVSDADAVLGLRAKVKSDAALRQAAKVRGRSVHALRDSGVASCYAINVESVIERAAVAKTGINWLQVHAGPMCWDVAC
jgi:hypothetical protein